ncbi:hypothetical protein [Halomonas icarae]|uniref:Uncharacterized protein n=1 Tax=Halomonas icarae TaxID=2691040 RepID=A0A7X5AMA9_9GAMM|nr:hypothetical protein [Halomonas icarae]MDR5902625.1 hypothetical protein [Halomonas icarae]NAW12483.1 hypothetical protein [Halomonas icarae]
MAIEQGIWKLAGNAGEPPQKLRPTGLADESLLALDASSERITPNLNGHTQVVSHRGTPEAGVANR